MVAETVRVVIATVGVAATAVAVVGVGATAGIVLADVVRVGLASVGGESVGVRVGLPDIDLSAARAHGADTSLVIGIG